MKSKNLDNIIFVSLFPAVLFYYEIIFSILTKGSLSPLKILFLLLFGITLGGIDYLLCSLFKDRKINKILSCVMLGITALFFLIQFFVFKQFKNFYDLTTMFSGAGGVLTGYFKETLAIIFDLKGIAAIVLYLLPTVLYAVFANKKFYSFCSNMIFRIISGGSALLSLILALLIIFNTSSLCVKFESEYNYQIALDQFGFLPSAYLDLKNIIFPKKVEFVPVTNELSLTGEAKPEHTFDEQGKPFGKNELNIDFTALNEGANSDVVNLNNYVGSLTATDQNKYTGIFKDKNLIFITAEAFSSQVINKDLTPTLYRLATKGINFTDYYQTNEAGTTGGEYQNVFGLLATAGGKSFKNTQKNLNYFTMGSQLDRLGYYGKAYHNNSYTFYDRHLTHINLGYSDGFMGYGNGMEQYVQNKWPQSDFEMISGTLPTYIDKEKFNIYYMSVSGHNNYSTGGNAMTARHWDRVKDLPYSDTVKGYFAANLDLEDALTHLVAELEKKGIADDTVIAIATDHFPYGLSADRNDGGVNYLAELYGYDIDTCFDRDKNRLIIWSGCLEDKEPIIVSEPTSSVDILPTLSNLFGTEFDSRFMVGRDVFSNADALVFYSNYSFKTSLGTYIAKTGEFIPVSEDTVIPDGYVTRVKAIIKNKIKYCNDAPKTDYLRHIFE